MKKLRILSIFAVLILLVFSSCKMNTEKSKEVLDNATQNTVDQFTSLQSTEFNNAITSFFNLGSFPSSQQKSTKSDFINFRKISKVKNFGNAIRNSITTNYPKIFNKKIWDENFSISEYAGTYTYKASDSTWDYSSSPSDEIIVVFPSKGSSTNDLRFEWTEYSEVKTNEGYYPSTIKAALYKDNKKIGLIDYDVTWDLSNAIPVVAKIELGLYPIKYKLDYTFENKIMKINTSINKNARRLDDLSAELTFKDNTLDDEPLTVKGIFKTYDINKSINMAVLLKIKFDINYGAMGDEPDCDVVNQNTNIELYGSSNRLIGTVQCVDNDDCGADIIFNDGTSAPVCDYFDKISDALDDALSNEM